MDTKKLRQKILDLAIHGKLVPQDPNDEPASVLLERIRAEKERLISEGKIKRSRKSAKTTDTHHYEQDVLFEVPAGWKLIALEEIFILNPKNEVDDETLAGFIPMALVDDGFCGSHSFEQELWKNIKKGFSHFQNGDIGIAKISPCFENMKSVIFNNLPNGLGAGTTELTILRGILIDVKFYLYLFKTSWYINQGTKYFKGVVGQQRVNKAIFTTLEVPLPPLAEQRRIVAEIERWFTLVDTIERGKENLETSIKQAKSKILDLAIHGKLVPQDPNDEPASELLKRINPKAQITCDNGHSRKLPKGWYNTTLANMCNTTNGLWKGKKPPFVKVGVIRNANFTKYFTLDYSKIEYIDVEQRAFEKKHLLHGDLIVEKSGGSDKNPVGRAIFFDGEDGLFSFSNFTMCLRCKDQTTLMSKYLFYLLLCIYSRGDMVAMQTQTTGLHNLLVEKFMAMTFPLPPFAEQKRIVQKIEELFSLLDCIEKALQA